MTNTEVYNVLDDQWHALDAHMDDLIAAATTRQQGEALIQAWQQANANALAARNAIFTTNDAQLLNLVTDTQAAQASVEADLGQLQQLAQSLQRFNDLVNDISHVVALGTQVVAAIAML